MSTRLTDRQMDALDYLYSGGDESIEWRQVRSVL